MSIIPNIRTKGRLFRFLSGLVVLILLIAIQIFLDINKSVLFLLTFIFTFAAIVGFFQGTSGFCVMHGLKGSVDIDMKSFLEKNNQTRTCPIQQDQKTAKTVILIALMISLVLSIILFFI